MTAEVVAEKKLAVDGGMDDGKDDDVDGARNELAVINMATCVLPCILNCVSATRLDC